MSKYFRAEIVENRELDTCFRLLTIAPLSQFLTPEPGQFCMLQTGESYDPLLKRPFSVFRHDRHSLQFLYRVRGRGTICLSNLKPGTTIHAIGPLGKGYPPPDGDFIAVAGGIGIASLFHLLEEFSGRAHLFYGARSKEELVMLDEAKHLSRESVVTTDDGSEGEKGLITEALRVFLGASRAAPSPRVYACGPVPMLRELSRVVLKQGVTCFASLEETMACGIGACLGCVVKVKGRDLGVGNSVSKEPDPELRIPGSEFSYERACKEGPVFALEEVLWE